METEYKFNPLDYGFEPVEKFPELSDPQWYGSDTSVKITAGSWYGRKVYWYLACRPNTHDDRVIFFSHSWDENEYDRWEKEICWPKRIYSGLVSTDEFAKQLLYHLMGTAMNKGVYTDGVERFNKTNDQFLEQIKKEKEKDE